MVSSTKNFAFPIFDPKSCQPPTIDSHRSYVIYDLFFYEIRDQECEFGRFSDQKCWFPAWKFSHCSMDFWSSISIFSQLAVKKKYRKHFFWSIIIIKHLVVHTKSGLSNVRAPQHEHGLFGLEIGFSDPDFGEKSSIWQGRNGRSKKLISPIDQESKITPSEVLWTFYDDGKSTSGDVARLWNCSWTLCRPTPKSAPYMGRI